MMKKTRAAAIAALGLGVVLAAAACSSGGSSARRKQLVRQRPGHADLLERTPPPVPASRTSRTPSSTFDAAHPGVTIKMQNIQNERLRRQAADRAELEHRAGHLLPARRRQDAGHGQREPAPGAEPQRRGQDQRRGRPRSPATASTARSTASRSTRNPEGIYYSKDLFTAGRHHRDADHHPRARGRRRQAEGRRHRADRGRRQGRVAGRPLVLQLRAARVQPGHDERRQARASSSPTRAGPRPATTCRRS